MKQAEATELLQAAQATPVGKDARLVEADGQWEIHYCISEGFFYCIRSQAEYATKLKQGWLHNEWLEILHGEKFSGAWWW